MALVTEIRKREQISTMWKYIADNSGYAFYGKAKSNYNIWTHKMQGTRICWQHFRKLGLTSGLKNAVVTLNEFKGAFANEIFQILSRSIRKRTGYLIKSKKEVFFQS